MKLTKERRKAITNAQNITSIIKEKLRAKDSTNGKGIDLTRIAKDLADRRDKDIKQDE